MGRYMIPPLKPKPTPCSKISCHTWRRNVQRTQSSICSSVKAGRTDLRCEAGAKETCEVERERTPHRCFHIFWVTAEHDRQEENLWTW